MKKKKAFTLIELIIVIAILAILAAIAIPVFSNITEKAKVAQLEGDIKLIQSAAISTYNDTERFLDYDGKLNIWKANGKLQFLGMGSGREEDSIFVSKIGGLNCPFNVSYGIDDVANSTTDAGAYLQLYIYYGNMTESAKEKLKKDLGTMITSQDSQGFSLILEKY